MKTISTYFTKSLFLLLFILASTQVFAWKPIMIGHRGSRSGVENTKEAFENGIEVYGFQALECDVKVTADNQYICWHDNNLDRAKNEAVIVKDASGNQKTGVVISSTNLSTLQSYTLTQTRNSVSYTGKICTLREFLTICKNKNVTAVVELKYTKTIEEDGDLSGLDGIYSIIKDLNMEDKVIILGFKAGLIYFNNNYPNIQCMWLTNSISDDNIKTCIQYGWWIDSQPYLDYSNSTPITAAQIQKCQDAGVKVGLWTINNQANCNTYAGYGVNFITSDDIKYSQITDQTGKDPNNTKTIYFRPSTVCINSGYYGSWGQTTDKTGNAIAWTKYTSNTRFLVVEKEEGNSTPIHHIGIDDEWKNQGTIIPQASVGTTTVSRFLPINLGVNSSFAFYRMQGESTSVGATGTGCHNCVPNNEWWKNKSGDNVVGKWTDKLISVESMGDYNMVAIQEGYWATGREDKWKGYYLGYYLEEDAHLYFENKNSWDAPTFLRGKDIYAYSHETEKIENTNLYYCKLAKPTTDVESGIAYTQYAFIDHATTKGDEVNNEDIDLWKRYPGSSGSTNLEFANKDNNSFDKLRKKTGYSYTGVRSDKLSGKTRLFIPGASNNATLEKEDLTSWQDLNHTQTIKVEGGGKINYYTHKLKSASESKVETALDQTGTVTFTAAYTATVLLRAKKVDGYVFMGWFEEGSNTPLAAEVEAATGDVIYRYEAPNATPKALIARYEVSVNKQLRVQTYIYDNSTSKYDWKDDYTGGQFTMNYNNGSTAIINQKPASDNKWHSYDVSVNYPATFQATANTGYTFVGWWNNEKGIFIDNPLTMDNPADYDQKVTARFAQMYAQTIETTNNGGTVKIEYDIARKDTLAITTSGTYNVLTNSTVKVTANPFTGADFDGWYVGGTCVSTELTYSYNATAAKTLTARFTIPEIPVSTQVFQILTYFPEFDIFREYNTGNAGKINISYTSKEHGAKSINTESSCAITDVQPETSITLTATLTKDNHEFIGWYDQETKKLFTELTYTYTPTTGKIIQARFAPTIPANAWKVRVDCNMCGTYTLQYSKYEDFSVSQNIESSYTENVYAYVPNKAYLNISSIQPNVGYKCLRYKVGGRFKEIGTPLQCTSPTDHNVQVELVRDEEQVVYLNLKGNGGNIPSNWSTSTPDQYAYYAYVINDFESKNVKQKWIRMTHVQDYCYTCTIPGNTYSKLNFVQIHKDKISADNITLDNNTTLGLDDVNKTYGAQRVRSGYTTIPATTANCYRLSALYKGGKFVNYWTTPPTHTNDYRIIYREQTVKSKTEIEIDYEHDSDNIKYAATGTKVDTVSLHIYNKVSKDGVNAINNPEIILQQYDGSKWVDKESYMVFGPLKSDNPSVIRMPERKNSAEIVVNRGIDIIKNDPTDNGCGVWNFPITQTNGEVTLNLDKVRRYSGNYYICTGNADGGRENYTHPANVLKYSKYAKENDRGFSHYFLRYINIATNDKPGTYKNLKFNIACDYASFLSKEHLTIHNRFKNSNGEYDRDIYVLEVGGEPNLAENANVRFSWDIVTNRVFRSYIAETSYRTNEHLVLDATNGLSNINPNDNYFVDNGNWIYNIDFNATSSANAKVKARLNGQYQYFMGSEDATEPITIGTGSTTFPARLLYDFKDDRLITFYKPDGIINGNIELATPLMMVREHHGEATQIQFANSGNQITTKAMDANDADDQYANPVYAVLTFLKSKLTDPAITHHEKSFYWISFPFDVKIKDVFGLGKYGQKWLIETYDGKKRSQEGLVTTGWKYITNTGTILKANKGYVLSLDYNAVLQENMFDGSTDGKISLFFPSRYLQTKQVIKNETNVTVELPEYNYNTAPHHNNWHTIGVPSFANSKVTIEQNDMPFVYEYWHPGDAYGPVAHGEKPLKAMHSYMAQYSGDITWESIIRMTPQSLAAKKDTDADKKIMLRLELQQADSTIDKTYVQLRNDKGTKGFDMSLDLTKIINAGANIYSIVDNHEMAGNAIPKDETVLPLGVVITAAGEYTFAMPNGTEGMIVELIDYEQGTCTNLLVGDYTVNMPVGTNNTRFALRLVPDKVATSVDNIGNEADGDKVRKLLIDGVLYLVKDGAVYDAQGHCVR